MRQLWKNLKKLKTETVKKLLIKQLKIYHRQLINLQEELYKEAQAQQQAGTNAGNDKR